MAALVRMLVAKGRPNTTEVEGRSLRRTSYGHVSTKNMNGTQDRGLKKMLAAEPH
jgi:hypothetical protein